MITWRDRWLAHSDWAREEVYGPNNNLGWLMYHHASWLWFATVVRWKEKR